jgi:peroxiredoxin
MHVLLQYITQESLMQIRYRTSTLQLEDMPLDIGYASDKVTLKNHSGETFTIGGQNGLTQLLISAPFIDDEFLAQLKEIDTLLSLNALQGIGKTIVVANPEHADPRMEGWMFGVDTAEEFGDYYGIRLAEGELGGEFAKALFVISKDGALFYNDIPQDLNEPFSLEKALPKIAAAGSCYTGKGCH